MEKIIHALKPQGALLGASRRYPSKRPRPKLREFYNDESVETVTMPTATIDNNRERYLHG
jgi:hypothetical protein